MTKYRKPGHRHGTDLLFYILENCEANVRVSQLTRQTKCFHSTVIRQVTKLEELDLVNVQYNVKVRMHNGHKLSQDPVCFKQKTITASKKGLQALEVWRTLKEFMNPTCEVSCTS